MFMNALLQTTSATGSLGMVGTILPFLLIFLIFYIFLIRPQNKKQKETEKMIAAVKKGDKVTTIGGIHGVVSSTKEKTLIIKVDDNCKLEMNRAAVSAVENKEKPATEKVAKKNKKDKIDEIPAEEVDETKNKNSSKDK